MALRSRTRATPPRGTGPLDVVDTALAMAARRELLTAEEASDLLEGVLNKVHGLPRVEADIARIVAAAARSYSLTPLVDRARVVDPLLDIRLVVSA